MEGEQKNLFYQQRVAALERIVGQKQMEIEYLNKTLEIATEELGYDVKKVRTRTLEWFRKNIKNYLFQMNALYVLNGISKQGHFEALKWLNNIQILECCYVGYIETIREMYLGMGLRKMYEQFQPEDIGRDAFISLGLRAGYRISTVVDKPYKTT